MAFYVGQKVVCVDATSPQIRPSSGPVPYREGAVYTVTSTRDDPWTGVPSLRLSELPDSEDGCDVWYQAKRFRPIVENSTDAGMSILREILDRETDNPPAKAKPRKIEIS